VDEDELVLPPLLDDDKLDVVVPLDEDELVVVAPLDDDELDVDDDEPVLDAVPPAPPPALPEGECPLPPQWAASPMVSNVTALRRRDRIMEPPRATPPAYRNRGETVVKKMYR
jgi:hypothetical protein